MTTSRMNAAKEKVLTFKPNVMMLILIVATVGFCFLFIILLCTGTFATSIPSETDTRVNLRNLGSPQPLILKPGTNDGNEKYYWPVNSEGDIIFKDGDVVTVACPGNSIELPSGYTGRESAEAVCNSGMFTILGSTVPFASIKCLSNATHIAKYTGMVCLGSYKEVEIGFYLDKEFIRHIVLCFDDQNQNTLYVEFNMTKFINGYQRNVDRPDFIQDNFYNVGSVNALYTRKTQRKTINALVGLPASSYKYISQTDDYFLTRGHMAAKVDFVYELQQRATFHYINVAPQWQTFNGGNWNTLEQDVRNFVSQQNTDIIVYTGTHGVAILPHENENRDVKLYLYTSGNRKAIPVPRLFWKVLYKPSEKSGIAFVGLNNPYTREPTVDVICKNICDQVDWLHWNANNVTLGYSYCCDVNDLRTTIKTLPEFTVNTILQ